MKIDELIVDYFEQIASFNPDTSTDAERIAILQKGIDLLEEKTKSKPKSMKDIVDKHAAKVDTSTIDIPEYLVSDISVARVAVKEMVDTRKATIESYRDGVKSIFVALIKLATLSV